MRSLSSAAQAKMTEADKIKLRGQKLELNDTTGLTR